MITNIIVFYIPLNGMNVVKMHVVVFALIHSQVIAYFLSAIAQVMLGPSFFKKYFIM